MHWKGFGEDSVLTEPGSTMKHDLHMKSSPCRTTFPHTWDGAPRPAPRMMMRSFSGCSRSCRTITLLALILGTAVLNGTKLLKHGTGRCPKKHVNNSCCHPLLILICFICALLFSMFLQGSEYPSHKGSVCAIPAPLFYRGTLPTAHFSPSTECRSNIQSKTCKYAHAMLPSLPMAGQESP